MLRDLYGHLYPGKMDRYADRLSEAAGMTGTAEPVQAVVTDAGQFRGAVSVVTMGALGPAARMSMLMARIQAGNSSSAQGEIPTPTSSTSAVASPVTVSHLDTILVRRAMVTVVSVNTAAIRIA
jgi:hypothetical protein